MKHIDLIEEYYKPKFEIFKNSKNILPKFLDITLEFDIVGDKSEKKLDVIAEVLDKIYDLHFADESKADINDTIVVGRSGKRNREYMSFSVNSENWSAVLSSIEEKKTKHIKISSFKNNELDVILDYKNYKYYYDTSKYDSFEIKLTITLKSYNEFTEKKKQEQERLWIDSFCKLNGISFTVSHYEDLVENLKYVSRYYVNPDKYIFGSFWCNVITADKLTKIGGADAVEEKAQNFITKRYSKNNGEEFLFVKLCSNANDMTQKQLKEYKEIIADLVAPTDVSRYLRLRGFVSTMDTTQNAYKSRKQQLDMQKFVLENIVLYDGDDIKSE